MCSALEKVSTRWIGQTLAASFPHSLLIFFLFYDCTTLWSFTIVTCYSCSSCASLIKLSFKDRSALGFMDPVLFPTHNAYAIGMVYHVLVRYVSKDHTQTGSVFLWAAKLIGRPTQRGGRARCRSQKHRAAKRSKEAISRGSRPFDTPIYCSRFFSVARNWVTLTITFGQVLRTLREFAWPLPARGAYTILSDEDIEIGGLRDFNYCWHAVVGGTGEGVQVEGGAVVQGAAPVGSRGEAPAGGSRSGAPRLPRHELKMFHK